jgi:prephenate dehydrogenase
MAGSDCLKIAVIGGAGKMGRWFTRFLLEEGYEVIISDRDQDRLKASRRELGVRTASNINAVKHADVILISIGIDSIEEVVKEIGPFVRTEQIVLDVTSIKEFPIEVMHKYLKTPNILGTHPLFGPGARDLANQNFALTPTNERENILAQKVQELLKSRGARVTIMSPGEHDEIMTIVLGLAHFVAIVAADTLASTGKLTKTKAIGGSTYRVLTTLAESVISEEPELYATLQMRLPRLSQLEEVFQNKVVDWANLVKRQDKEGFIKNMTALKRKFAENNADFGEAYGNMYKIMEWL